MSQGMADSAVLAREDGVSIVDYLKRRGYVYDISDEAALRKACHDGIVTGYIGFDPTADSLHIGSLVPIILLVHLQKAGHKPIALVGGATGMVGDPSFKSEERNMLSEEVLNKNVEGIRNQLMKYLDFDTDLPNSAEMVNN